MTKLNVHIVRSDSQYERMFREWGWNIVSSIDEADLIQFTGGEDVSPELYGHSKHPTTRNNIDRDRKECVIWQLARAANIPMAGICRGGQFLNVMCGGEMWQDVAGHTCGVHVAFDRRTEEQFLVSSTHHQMMIPGKGGEVIVYAKGIAFSKTMTGKPGSGTFTSNMKADDVEAVWYQKHNCFCFQPHPEFYPRKNSPLSEIYMEYLSEFFKFPIPDIAL